jgi:HK97 gp10 family phage protein
MANRADVTMRITGVEELKKALESLPAATRKNVLKRALVQASVDVVARAKELAPYDEARKEGHHLRDSISASFALEKRQRAFVKQHGSSRDVALAFIGVSYSSTSDRYAPHAHLIEFGTGPRQHKSGKSTGQVVARPFLRPAWDEKQKTVIERFAPLLAKEIDAAAARLFRKALRAAR